MNMAIIYWMMNDKRSRSKWPWLIELQESCHEFTDLSLVQEVETDRRAPSNLCLLWALGSGNNPSPFTACEGKQYANLLALMCTVARHYWGLIFTFLQTSSSLRHSVPWPSKPRASGNSHLFVGPPNHPVDHEMSSFHHSEMQMTDATIISHPVIISYAFWKGRKCVALSLSLYCLLLQRMMTSTQMHEKVR